GRPDDRRAGCEVGKLLLSAPVRVHDPQLAVLALVAPGAAGRAPRRDVALGPAVGELRAVGRRHREVVLGPRRGDVVPVAGVGADGEDVAAPARPGAALVLVVAGARRRRAVVLVDAGNRVGRS